MPVLWMSFVMLAVVGTLGYNFSVVFPLFVEQGLGGSDATYTFVYAVFSVGALVGALAAANRAEASMRMIVAGSAAFGAAMVLLTFVPNVWWAYPVVLLVGTASIVYMTSTTAIVQVRARPVDARSGARAPDGAAGRHHADRWPDPGSDLRPLRAAHARRRRSGGEPRRSGMGVVDDAPPLGRPGATRGVVAEHGRDLVALPLDPQPSDPRPA